MSTVGSTKRHRGVVTSASTRRGPRHRVLETMARARWHIALVVVAFVSLIPYFASGDPPGVDAPTFLHFGWVFEQSLLGSGGSFFTDEWWYGGLPYLQAYSPGGYGAAGLLSAITPLEIATAFKLVMAVSLAGTAATTYWLGRTLRLSPLYAFFAAALLLLSYPVIAGVGIFGWLPTLASMPFAMAAYVYVEKWTASRNSRHAMYAGALLGVSLFAHHMTAIAFGIAVSVRLAVFVLDTPTGWRDGWKQVRRSLVLFTAGAAVTSAWWGVPFLVNTISVGFQRELPGNWEFGVSTFATALFDRGRIGVETFPSYIGIVQGVLGIAGAIYAIIYRTRFRGVAIAAVVLFWFSTGASANPLVRVYPFSGFDVSRFAFYVAPLLALLSAAAVRAAVQSQDLRKYPALPVVAVAVLLILPVLDAVASHEVLEPVDEPQAVTESINWISENVPADSKILAVGYRNWDGYWIPQRAGTPIMDGWYDEGAENWRNVRDYRLMGWLGNVDADRLHEIMVAEETEYLVIMLWDTTESPRLFQSAVTERLDLFELRANLDDAFVYRRL